jgi:hypothetical protein
MFFIVLHQLDHDFPHKVVHPHFVLLAINRREKPGTSRRGSKGASNREVWARQRDYDVRKRVRRGGDWVAAADFYARRRLGAEEWSWLFAVYRYGC